MYLLNVLKFHFTCYIFKFPGILLGCHIMPWTWYSLLQKKLALRFLRGTLLLFCFIHFDLKKNSSLSEDLKPVLLFISHRASVNAPGTKQLFLWIKKVFGEALMLCAGSLMLGLPLGTDSLWALWPPKTLDGKVRAWYQVQILQV